MNLLITNGQFQRTTGSFKGNLCVIACLIRIDSNIENSIIIVEVTNATQIFADDGTGNIGQDTVNVDDIVTTLLPTLLPLGNVPDNILKILAIFPPIALFVVSGYEHCVANMYFIPAAIFTSMEYGLDAGSVNWGSMVVNNLIPVTIGNIIGGALIIGVALKFAVKDRAGI